MNLKLFADHFISLLQSKYFAFGRLFPNRFFHWEKKDTANVVAYDFITFRLYKLRSKCGEMESIWK